MFVSMWAVLMMWEYRSTTANDSSCARGISCHKQHILKFYRLARFVRPKCFQADLPCHIFFRTYNIPRSCKCFPRSLTFFPTEGTFFCLANKIHHFSLVIRKNVKKSGQRNRDSTWSRALFICRSLLQRLLQCLCMCRWRQHKWHYLGTKPVWIMVCLEKKRQTFSQMIELMFRDVFLEPMIWYDSICGKKQSLMLQWLKAMGMICLHSVLGWQPWKDCDDDWISPAKAHWEICKIVQFLESNSIHRIGVHPGICCFQIQPHSEIHRKLSYSLLRMRIQKQHLDGLLSTPGGESLFVRRVAPDDRRPSNNHQGTWTFVLWSMRCQTPWGMRSCEHLEES